MGTDRQRTACLFTTVAVANGVAQTTKLDWLFWRLEVRDQQGGCSQGCEDGSVCPPEAALPGLLMPFFVFPRVKLPFLWHPLH